MRDPHDMEKERRKLFRRMEWIYVYAPPLLAALVGMVGGLVLALMVPVAGIGFWGRWAIAVVIILGVPLLGYVIRERIRR